MKRITSLFAASLLALAACGDKSSSDTTTADTSPDTTAQSTVPATTLPAVPVTTGVPLTNVVPADAPIPDVTCADIEPPKDFRLSDSANAHVKWTFVMAPPPQNSPNQLNLETSTDNGGTWQRAAFMRISLTSALLTDVKPGTTVLVRAQLYRAFKNPCITEHSNSVALTIK